MVGGVAAGLLIVGVIIHAGRRDLIAPQWRQVIPAAGAALAYGIAAALGGSGFIEAFVGAWCFAGRSGGIRRTSTNSASRLGTFSTASRSFSSGRF